MTQDVYVVYGTPIDTLDVPQTNGVETQENKPTPKRLDFCIVEAGAQGKSTIHGTNATSIAAQVQGYIASSIFELDGFYQRYPTPSPIWSYVATNKAGGQAKADCIQQSCLLAAGLGQLGVAALGDRAYPTTNLDCSSRDFHPTVPYRVLRYVVNSMTDDTSRVGAYPNNFQATAWVQDEYGVKKFYTMWPLYPPQNELIDVLRYEKSENPQYLQYWSHPVDDDPSQDPSRFIDEVLHPKRPQTNWPPVWDNDVPLP